MNYDLSEIISYEEMCFLKGIIEETKSNSLDKYYYTKKVFDLVIEFYEIKKDVIDSLLTKSILKLEINEKCKVCDSSRLYCICEDPEIVNEKYYFIDIDVFTEYIIHTLEYLYNIKLSKTLKVRDEKVISFEGDKFNTCIHFYYNKLSKEFFSTTPSKDQIYISIMPISDFEYSFNLFEWHEILDDDKKFNRLMKDIHLTIISKDYYVLDIGDDIENDDVESIRDTFRKFMIKQEYTVFTEIEKYRPEISDYSLQVEKIKEVFIKDNKKVFVIKPSPKEIYLALFSNGSINNDKNLHNTINSFDRFIKSRVQKNRNLKKLQQRVSHLEKSLVFLTTIINTFAYISGVIQKNPIFIQINDFFKSPIPLYSFISLNVFYALVLFITVVLPKIKIFLFEWDNGLSSIK